MAKSNEIMVDEVLGIENTEDTKTNTNDKQQQRALDMFLNPPEEVIRGKMKLTKGLYILDKETFELEYDFESMTGDEYVKAMDSDKEANQFITSNKQYLNLFAAAVTSKGVDKYDILQRLSMMDTKKAVEIAKVFFVGLGFRENASSKKI